MNTNGHAWKCACNFCRDVKKEKLFCNRLSQEMKYGCTTVNLQSVPSAGKVMLVLFWDFNGPILEHFQVCGQTVNKAQYCAMLEVELKPTVHSKCRGMLTDGVVYLTTMLDLVWQQQPLKQFKN